MIHLGALPGTPASELTLAEIEKLAVREAKLLRDAGVHGLMIENMHDTPYLRGRVGPEIVAAMTIIGRAVKETAKLPCGVQILARENIGHTRVFFGINKHLKAHAEIHFIPVSQQDFRRLA